MHKAKPSDPRSGGYQRDDGLWVYRKVPARRAVGADHALDLRPRRAGHPVPRPHQPRQQPQLLRDDRGYQPLRRAAAAALRLLLPGLDRPDPLRARALRRRGLVRLRALSPRWWRSRCACWTTCSTSLPGRWSSSTPRRWPSGASAWASPGWATRWSCCGLRYDTDEARAHGGKDRRGDARQRLPRLGRARARARRVPAVQRRPLSFRHQLRLAPAGRDQGADPQARHPQQPPAVDRADRHHQPRFRRQRLQRHRAAVLLGLHAQEAHARRQH